MTTLLIGILLGVTISPLGFGLARGLYARITAARAVRRVAPAAPPPDTEGVEEAVYSDLYETGDSGLVERVPRESATAWR
jgi:hypothetical protein